MHDFLSRGEQLNVTLLYNLQLLIVWFCVPLVPCKTLGDETLWMKASDLMLFDASVSPCACTV